MNEHDYEVFDGENLRTRKITALCYVGPLFFIPLLLRKNSKYVRFHTNQGCALFLCELAAFFLMYGILGLFAKGACIYLAVKGFRNAAAGIEERLPYIGSWNVIKFR